MNENEKLKKIIAELESELDYIKTKNESIKKKYEFGTFPPIEDDLPFYSDDDDGCESALIDRIIFLEKEVQSLEKEKFDSCIQINRLQTALDIIIGRYGAKLAEMENM